MAFALFLALGLAAQETVTTNTECDIGRGQVQFTKCAICHTNEPGAGPGALGPNLFGILDKPVAAAEDFYYTEVMVEYGEKWTAELLDRFLVNPMLEVPGTTMAFAGLKNDDDRAALVCFLSQSGKSE